MAVQQLFAASFDNSANLNKLAQKAISQKERIDSLIGSCAPEWPIEKINKIDLAILRLAIFELTAKTAPQKVIIDEAVELAKTYGSQSSASFVNGVLGTALKKLVKKPKKRQVKQNFKSFFFINFNQLANHD